MDSTATGTFSSVVSGATGGTAYGSWSQVTGNNGTAIGYSSLAGNGAVAMGYASQATGTSSVAIGYGAVANAANSVAIGSGSVANEANTVSVGSSGNERRVTNVAPGVNGTDAVNVNQLNTGMASTLSTSMSYTDRRVSALQNWTAGQLFDLKRTASFGIAGATAIAMIPDIDPGQKFSFGVGVAGFNGYAAVGLGFTGRLGDHVKVKAGASVSGGQSTYGGGISFGF